MKYFFVDSYGFRHFWIDMELATHEEMIEAAGYARNGCKVFPGTGLNDKNGEDILVGDIVVFDFNLNHQHEIIVNSGRFFAKSKENGSEHYFGTGLATMSEVKVKVKKNEQNSRNKQKDNRRYGVGSQACYTSGSKS